MSPVWLLEKPRLPLLKVQAAPKLPLLSAMSARERGNGAGAQVQAVDGGPYSPHMNPLARVKSIGCQAALRVTVVMTAGGDEVTLIS